MICVSISLVLSTHLWSLTKQFESDAKNYKILLTIFVTIAPFQGIQSIIYFCIWDVHIYVLIEKGRYFTQSYDKSPYTHRKIQQATWQHKTPAKTSFTQRLQTYLGAPICTCILVNTCVINLYIVWYVMCLLPIRRTLSFYLDDTV